MRKLLFAAMAVVMVMGISRTTTATATATADAMTASRLLEMCESKLKARDMMCWAYLAGFLQGLSTANSGLHLGKQVCWPKNFNALQLRKMFVKSANERPDALHIPAGHFLFGGASKPFMKSTAEGSCYD